MLLGGLREKGMLVAKPPEALPREPIINTMTRRAEPKREYGR
jgi:hypothetical protein